jgi:hypothetical protein
MELRVGKSQRIDELVGWFHTLLTEAVTLSTSPFTKETHWKETIFSF